MQIATLACYPALTGAVPAEHEKARRVGRERLLMGFLSRELDRVSGALLREPPGPIYDQLYAAQQALSWASDPNGFRSPYDQVMGIQGVTEGCSIPGCQPRSEGISDR